jgi:hypothetical protein
MHLCAWWKPYFLKREGGMGFRDFHYFNVAMLAKSVCKLIDNQDSICAKVLKAKYFPHCHILQVGPKSNYSFTWQSIATGIKTFKRGCIWRIGDGAEIKIWEDPWVPASPNKKVTTARCGSIITKVSDLLTRL